MATIQELMNNRSKTFTVKDIVNAKGSDKGFYLVVTLSGANYAIAYDALEANIANDDYKFKVNKSGQWLVPTTSDFTLDLTN